MDEKKPIEGIDYFVRLVDFPVGSGSNGMVMLNDDGTYSVYINARAGHHAKKKAMRHEYDHMANGDIYCEDVRKAEKL